METVGEARSNAARFDVIEAQVAELQAQLATMQKQLAEREEEITLLVSLGCQHEERIGRSDDALRHHKMLIA